MTRPTTPPRRRRLTSKERVLRKFRRASIGKLRRYERMVVFYRVYKGPHEPFYAIGQGFTPRQAWADAARKL